MRRVVMPFVVILLVFAWTPMARAKGPPIPPREPVPINYLDLVMDEVELIEVPAGSWLLFRWGWGFATDTSLTDPAEYLEAVLGGAIAVEFTLDGNVLPMETSWSDSGVICYPPAGGGTDLCREQTGVLWLSLHRPLGVGNHTIEFDTVFTTDMPDDGWGYGFQAGDDQFSGAWTIEVTPR